MQFGLESGRGGRGIRLRHLGVDAQAMDVRQAKQLRARRLTGVDEIAHIGVSSGDDAVEGGDHALEGLEIGESRDVLPGRIHGGLLGGGVGRAVVRILDGNRLRLEQALPTLVGDERYGQIGLRGCEIRMRLLPLLVHFRCLDVRQQVAFVDLGADVGAPALQISAGSGVNRRFDVSLDDAREHQFVSGPAPLRFCSHHGRERILGAGLAQVGTCHQAACDAPHRQHHRDDGEYEGIAPDPVSKRVPISHVLSPNSSRCYGRAPA